VGGLALALAALIAACAPEQTGLGPDGGLLDPPGPPAQGGQHTGGSALIGEWQVETVIFIQGDVQTTTARWSFSTDGSCRRTITTLLASEDIPRASVSDCTYQQDINAVIVTFPGSLPATFSVAFAAFDADRLVLDGLEYQRVG
jgi:hypothetical protein